MLTTRWAPASVSAGDSFHVIPNGCAAHSEGFGQSLLIRGLELSRGNEQDQLQAAFVTHSTTFNVVRSSSQQKVPQLFIAIKGEALQNTPLHDSSVSFLTHSTQVLDCANSIVISIEVLLIKVSLDKSNGICIIVGRKYFTWGRKASTDGEGDKGPSDSKPNDPDGRGFESHLLHWKRRFGSIRHEAPANCQGDKQECRQAPARKLQFPDALRSGLEAGRQILPGGDSVHREIGGYFEGLHIQAGVVVVHTDQDL